MKVLLGFSVQRYEPGKQIIEAGEKRKWFLTRAAGQKPFSRISFIADLLSNQV